MLFEFRSVTLKLLELVLSEELKNSVFEMAGTALQIVDESDVPTVVRTLLKSVKKG